MERKRNEKKNSNALKVTARSLPSGGRNATLRRWPTADSLMQTFHVNRQIELTQDPDRCYFSNAPTLNVVNNIYGEGTSEEWLCYQIGNLSEFSGARDKIDNDQLNEIAALIRSDYGFLNMAEIMLFCRRFKKGQYDKFYGSVDPITIMRGLNEFCKERSYAYFMHEQKERERIEAERSKQSYLTYEEYEFIKYAQLEYEMNTIEEDKMIELKHGRYGK